jgi:hypothetical protein
MVAINDKLLNMRRGFSAVGIVLVIGVFFVLGMVALIYLETTKDSILETVQNKEKIVIVKPSAPASYCIGEEAYINWVAPKDWEGVTIMLQESLTDGNNLIDSVLASKSLYVWRAGEVKRVESGSKYFTQPGETYRILMTRTNANYEENKVETDFYIELKDCDNKTDTPPGKVRVFID